MKLLARSTTIWLVLISCGSFSDLNSQTTTDKKLNTATVSGQVTIKGKGASGIVVALTAVNRGRSESLRYRATSDQDGNYRISDVSPGSYQVAPDAPAFVV